MFVKETAVQQCLCWQESAQSHVTVSYLVAHSSILTMTTSWEIKL